MLILQLDHFSLLSLKSCFLTFIPCYFLFSRKNYWTIIRSSSAIPLCFTVHHIMVTLCYLLLFHPILVSLIAEDFVCVALLGSCSSVHILNIVIENLSLLQLPCWNDTEHLDHNMTLCRRGVVIECPLLPEFRRVWTWQIIWKFIRRLFYKKSQICWALPLCTFLKVSTPS